MLQSEMISSNSDGGGSSIETRGSSSGKTPITRHVTRRLIPENKNLISAANDTLQTLIKRNNQILSLSTRHQTRAVDLNDCVTKPRVIDTILKSLSIHPMFSRLSASQQTMVAFMMRPVIFKAGDYVAKIGENGGDGSVEKFYVVLSGKCEQLGSTNSPEGGQMFLPGASFGCKHLLFEKVRTCSVISRAQSELYYLSSDRFRCVQQVVSQNILPTIKYFLRYQVEMMESLERDEKFPWLDLCNETIMQRFPQSHSFRLIYPKSELPSYASFFFVLFSGRCGVFRRNNATGSQRQIATLLPGQCFHTFVQLHLERLDDVGENESLDVVVRPLKNGIACLAMSKDTFSERIPQHIQAMVTQQCCAWIKAPLEGPNVRRASLESVPHPDRRRSTYMSRRVSMYGLNDDSDDEREDKLCDSEQNSKVSDRSKSTSDAKCNSISSLNRRISVQEGVSLNESMRPVNCSPSTTARKTERELKVENMLRKSFSVGNKERRNIADKKSSRRRSLPLFTRLVEDMSEQEQFEHRVSHLESSFLKSPGNSFRNLLKRRSTRDEGISRKRDDTLLVASLQKVLVLRGASEDLVRSIAAKMKCVEVSANTLIHGIGSMVSHLSLISEGTVALFDARSSTALMRTGDKIINPDFSSARILGRGDVFGEYGLLFAVEIEATVVSKTDGFFWTISGSDYRKLRAQHSKNDIAFVLRCLQGHEIFYSLTIRTITHIVDTFVTRTFLSGQVILQAGKTGSDLYLVAESSGCVQCVTELDDVKCTYKSGDFFGEKAMLKKESLKYNYVAVGQVTCFWIPGEVFFRLVANVDQLVRALDQEQKKVGEASKNAKGPFSKNIPKSLTAPSSVEAPGELSSIAHNVFKPTEFEVIECIGIGAFGRVALARHLATGKPYAIKQIAKMRRAKRSRKDEVDIMNRLKHSMIARMHGRFVCNSKIYLVLPFYHGGDLLSRLVACGKLSMGETRYYIASVHEALTYMHAKGIVYRDLKLENLMLTASGKLKLIDFGLAKLLPTGMDRTFTICGTVEYMSPEMITSAGYRTNLDIWALGILFHEFVTGRPPFGDRKTAKYPEVYEQIRYYTFRRKQMELDTNVVVGHSAQNAANRRLVSNLLPYFHMVGAGDDAFDLLLRLLSPVATMRPKDTMFKTHDFFRVKGFSWQKLIRGEMSPPYRPVLDGEYDTRYFDDFGQTKVLQEFFRS
eukprot:g1897.t1